VSSASLPSRRFGDIAPWIPQVVLVVLFLLSGVTALTGAGDAVQTFDEVGVGQWFRYLTGTLEIAGAVGLLIPRLAGVAALGLGGVMLGALATELFVLEDGDPITPLIPLVLAATVAWLRRDRTLALLDQLRTRKVERGTA